MHGWSSISGRDVPAVTSTGVVHAFDLERRVADNERHGVIIVDCVN